MPILGIIASQDYARFAPGSYESIATVTVGGGGAASVTFSSIPGTYTHLQIRGLARNSRTVFPSSGDLYQFNGDTAANYSWHSIQGDGGAASTRAAAGATGVVTNSIAAAGATSGIFGVIVFDILDYANTNKYKTTRALSGVDVNGTVGVYGGTVELVSGNWRSTSAITSITITTDNPNYVQYTQFALYGVKS
jgi:hypothetical protein